jgi:hypothetical protein
MTILHPMSRRIFLPLVVGAALSPALLVPKSAAQAANWQIYRRADLNFEIEMPGRPQIREDRADGLTSIEATVDVEQKHFGISYQEHEKTVSLQQVADHQRLIARSLGSEIARESNFTMSGFPALDIVMHSNVLSMALRIVIMPERKRSISAMVSGDGNLAESPSVRRFLDSFKLLP